MIWSRAIIGHYQMTKTWNLREMSWFGRSKHDRRRETPNACGLGALQAAMHARSSKDRKNLWKIGHLSCHLSNFNWNHIKIISKSVSSLRFFSCLIISLHLMTVIVISCFSYTADDVESWSLGNLSRVRQYVRSRFFMRWNLHEPILIWYAVISCGTFFPSKANG